MTDGFLLGHIDCGHIHHIDWGHGGAYANVNVAGIADIVQAADLDAAERRLRSTHVVAALPPALSARLVVPGNLRRPHRA